MCVPGVWEYIQQMRDNLHDFESRINQAKTNVEAMHIIMEVRTVYLIHPCFPLCTVPLEGRCDGCIVM
jgi:hypothetical protein